MSNKVADKDLILEHLKRYGSITTLDAINDYGCTRLSGRIYDLRKEGYAIKTEVARVPKRGGRFVYVSRYSLDGSE